jgi:hypothetical protein
VNGSRAALWPHRVEIDGHLRGFLVSQRNAGRVERAAEALERALTAYEQKGLVPMAERTRAELTALRAST